MRSDGYVNHYYRHSTIAKSMYVIGFFLLLIGLLLCLSIVWAPIGFFVMGFGLICLLLAEKRDKASKLRLERPPIQAVLEPKPLAPSATLNTRQQGAACEKDKWKLLVENDPDLARVERVLSQYGSRYVDQLARVYVVFDNKAFLPIMLRMIIASARLNAEGNQSSAGHVSENIEDRRCPIDEVAISDQPFRPEIHVLPQSEIVPHESEDGYGERVEQAPAALGTGVLGSLEPTSPPAADTSETDDLMRLFDKLISSRR